MKYRLWFLEKYFLFFAILCMNNNILFSTLNNFYDDLLKLLDCLLKELIIPSQNNSAHYYISDIENQPYYLIYGYL